MTVDAPWDPNQYLTFAGPRLRPALDLMARIPIEAPKTIFDLGCGAENVTEFSRQRWPDAAITGIDMSPEMLARARIEVPSIGFVEADLATWSPKQPANLVFSNAELQWIPDHKNLIPKIAAYVARGGVLAVQIPHNDNAPSTIAIKEAAQSDPWRNKLKTLERVSPVQDPSVYLKRWRSLVASLMIEGPNIIMFLKAWTRFWNGVKEHGFAFCSTTWTANNENNLRMIAARVLGWPTRRCPTVVLFIHFDVCFLLPSFDRRMWQIDSTS